jgi:F-type H+-transporting ATPase subunit b
LKGRLFAAMTFMLFAVTILAEEGESGHAEGWMSPIWHVPMIAWQIINILLVVFLFIYLLRRPAPQFFAGRAKDIQDLLEKATREKEEAVARLKEVEAKMAHLQDEISEIEESSVKAAEADKERVLAEAETLRERIKKEAQSEIERRLVEARRDLKIYAADLAVGMAKEALAKGISAADESALRERFMHGLEEGAHERGR